MLTATAFALFGLDHAEASPEDVRAAFRRLAPAAHPDLGGSAGDMKVLVEARAEALSYLAGLPCPVCAGVGRTLHADGWRSVNLPCAKCEGTGKKWFTSAAPRA